MGLVPCALACHSDKESESHSTNGISTLRSESSSSFSASLSSQPSLPSVPSLNRQYSSRRSLSVSHQCVATLKGISSSSSYVFSLALGGTFLYSGSSDSEIRAWNRDPSSLLENSSSSSINALAIATSHGAVKSLAVLGDKLFSAHQDTKIRVWKIEKGNDDDRYNFKCIATLPIMYDRFVRSLWAKNYVQVRRHKKRTWVHHVDTISALAVSREGSLLFSASWDRSFKVWQTSDFRCLESVANAHDDAINAIVVSIDGLVYTGSADKKIKVWKRDVAGKKKKKKHKNFLVTTVLEKHKSAVNALALSADGSVLYSGACDRSILVWEWESNYNVRTNTESPNMAVTGALRGHTKAILCMAVLSDLVCSGSADNTVRIWRRGAEKCYSCLAVFEGHRRPVKCLAAAFDKSGSNESGDSYLVYSGSLDGHIKIWRIWVPIL